MKDTINRFEAIAIIAVISISQIILNFPEYITEVTKTGSLINIIYIGIIGFIFCLIITKLLKNFVNSDLIDISKFIGGNFLKFIVSILFLGFLILSLVITILGFFSIIRTIFSLSSDILMLLLLMIFTIVISNIRGFNAIKKTISFFVIGLIISILSLLFGTLGEIDLHDFYPIFGINYSTTFLIGLQNSFILNFALIYFFLMPILTKKNDFKPIVFFSYFINIGLILISIIAILTLFSGSSDFSNYNSLNIIYLIVRKIPLTTFIEQTDAIFIFIWSFGIFCYTSFLLYCISYVLNKMFSFENKSITVFPISSIVLGLCLLITRIDIIRFLQIYIFKYFSIILLFGISFIILILGCIKKKWKGIKNEN